MTQPIITVQTITISSIGNSSIRISRGISEVIFGFSAFIIQQFGKVYYSFKSQECEINYTISVGYMQEGVKNILRGSLELIPFMSEAGTIYDNNLGGEMPFAPQKGLFKPILPKESETAPKAEAALSKGMSENTAQSLYEVIDVHPSIEIIDFTI